MPSTRPSTRVQRRAQLFVSRRRTRNHHEAPVPPVTTSQESSTTSGAVESTISSTLSTAEVTSITTAVHAQSVLASLQSALLPTPIQNAQKVPLVSLPGPSEADAQVQGPVASALEGLSGESVNLEVARP